MKALVVGWGLLLCVLLVVLVAALVESYDEEPRTAVRECKAAPDERGRCIFIPRFEK